MPGRSSAEAAARPPKAFTVVGNFGAPYVGLEPMAPNDPKERAAQAVEEISAAELARRLSTGEAVRLLDVREPDEVAAGKIAGAVVIPRAQVAIRARDVLDPAGPAIVVYCAGGARSRLAAGELIELGYRGVTSLRGGIQAWAEAGRPVESAAAALLDEPQRRRYARHLVIPELGARGQKRLLESRVLVVGAGGLGSPAALYLAAAGVGTLGLVDFDRVDESNLQRQILHTPSRVGWLKTDSARAALSEFSPATRLEPFPERLNPANVDAILAGYDLVVDGSDNFTTRYLVNDACVRQRKPFVFGAVFRFEGQVASFHPAEGGPCYRCLFPEPPPPGAAPSCAEAGVLGVVPGVIGSIQAAEAIKRLLGIGQPLDGRFLVYDALAATFRDFTLRRDPACRAHDDGAPLTTRPASGAERAAD